MIVREDDQIKRLLEEIAVNNCQKAYKALFMLLHGPLTRFATSILQSAEDGQEIVSDFFITVWQKRAAMHQLDNPKLYFYVSVKNLALNRLAQKKKRKLTEPDEWMVNLNSIFFNPEELMLSEEGVKRILDAINELPPKCKIIFRLVKEDGLRYTEVAKLLNLSVKTIEAQMAIALRRLKVFRDFKSDFPQLHSLLTQKK